MTAYGFQFLDHRVIHSAHEVYSNNMRSLNTAPDWGLQTHLELGTVILLSRHSEGRLNMVRLLAASSCLMQPEEVYPVHSAGLGIKLSHVVG